MTQSSCNCSQAKAQIWRKIEDSQVSTVIMNSVGLIQSHLAVSSASSRAERLSAIIDPQAGASMRWEIEAAKQERSSFARTATWSMDHFVNSLDSSKHKQLDEVFQKGAFKNFQTDIRRSVVASLVNSNISPTDAKSVLSTVDRQINELESIRSWKELTTKFNDSVERLGSGRHEELKYEKSYDLCYFILAFTGALAFIMIDAWFFCAAASLIGENYNVGLVFEAMTNKICPGSYPGVATWQPNGPNSSLEN